MKFLIPLIFISLVKSCDSQSLNIYDPLTKIADKNTNIQLYCSEVIDGLMTCETIEKKGVERNNDLIFGQSLLHLLRISESNDVKLIHSVLINNN